MIFFVKWSLSPEEFKTNLKNAKSFLDSNPSKGLASKIVLLDNWNECGEGHSIFPTEKYGFAYLDAVRNVFSPHSEKHRDIVPKDVNYGPYDLVK